MNASSSTPAAGGMQSQSSPAAAPRFDRLSTGIVLMLMLMVFQRLVGLTRNVLFCRFLEPDELGRWNLAFSLLVLAAPLIILGLPGSFGRYVEHYRQVGQLRTFLRRTSTLTALLAVVGVALLSFYAENIAWVVLGDATQVRFVWLIGATLLLVIAFNYFVELFTALRQIRVASLLRFSNSILFAVCALGLMLVYRQSAVSIVLGYALACLITGCVAVVPLWRTWRELPSPAVEAQQGKFWIKLLPFAAMLWFSDLLGNLFSAADRYMIVHFAGLQAVAAVALVGQYHSSRIVPELIASIADLLSGVTLPYQTDDWESGRRQRVSERLHLTFKLYGLAATVGGVVVLMIAPWLFTTVLNGKYADGQHVLPWTLIYCTWFGMCVILNNYLLCAERAGSRGLSLAIGLFVNVALNFILLPRLGLLGAVLATAAGNLAVTMSVYVFVRRAGLSFDLGTPVIAAMPLLLTMGTMVPVVGIVLTLALALGTNWLLSSEQRLLISQEFQRAKQILGQLLGRKNPRWSLQQPGN